ncbi:MAG TPA: cytidylate kinase-like family protein [Candidatus Binatia bacterium]|nr:cytidylate kinase-like family protein [Candidatus Binatia bacterium]
MAVVAISREIGTAGNQVGLAVARALGCAFVDREIIVEAARRYEVAAERLADVDERAPSFWQRFDRERRRLLVFIRAALLDRLADGACVVTGRLAPMLLRDVPPVLLVRVTAPLDVRVRRVMAEARLDEPAARAQIAAYERELAAQAQSLFDLEDWRDPVHYDVVVNTARLAVEECAALVVRAAEAEAHRPSPAVLARLRDHALAAAVHAALGRERTLGALAIEVASEGGRVTLGGAVIGPAHAARARAIAAAVPGVREILCRSAEPVPIPPVERV